MDKIRQSFHTRYVESEEQPHANRQSNTNVTVPILLSVGLVGQEYGAVVQILRPRFNTPA